MEEDKVVGDGYIVLVRVLRRNSCNAEEEGKAKTKTSGAMVDRAPGAMKCIVFEPREGSVATAGAGPINMCWPLSRTAHEAPLYRVVAVDLMCGISASFKTSTS